MAMWDWWCNFSVNQKSLQHRKVIKKEKDRGSAARPLHFLYGPSLTCRIRKAAAVCLFAPAVLCLGTGWVTRPGPPGGCGSCGYRKLLPPAVHHGTGDFPGLIFFVC